MRGRIIAVVAGLGLLLGTLLGCGKTSQGVPTVPVSGKVTLDGQPLDGAEVRFIGEKHVGFAKTEAGGVFTLMDGAQAGPNKVAISKIDQNRLPPNLRGLPMADLESIAQGQGMKTIPGQVVPTKYSDPATTTLSFDVPAEGTTNAAFGLSCKCRVWGRGGDGRGPPTLHPPHPLALCPTMLLPILQRREPFGLAEGAGHGVAA